MTPDVLLLDLHAHGVTITIVGDTIRTKGPQGAVTPALVDALKENKPLLLAVARTITDRDRDADWALLGNWACDHAQKIVTPEVIAAGRRIGFPYTDDLWPEAYARRVGSAVQVRAVLRVFEVAPATATMHAVHADNGKQEVA